MISDVRTLIFVYGTLKRGFCRSQFLKDQHFLDFARTVSNYTMYDCGEYPGLVVDRANGVSIQGELWSVDQKGIAILDHVEGVDENWFSRQPILLKQPLISGVVQAYFYEGSVTDLPVYGDNWLKGV